MDKTKELGQVFTSSKIVNQMLQLRSREGSVLEPSSGHGAFLNEIPHAIGIEFDTEICTKNALNIDFLTYSLDNKFDTVIGNPPYVGYNNVLPEVKANYGKSLIDGRGNLALRFIEKSFHHLNDNGEIIFIVPKEWLKATSAAKLNTMLLEHGTITHLIHMGEKAFPGFAPNTIIFRYEKGNFDRKVLVDGKEKLLSCVKGQLFFTIKKYTIPFTDYFYVKVGAASGADKIFESSEGNQDFVVSSTVKDRKTKRYFYDIEAEYLLPFKKQLLNRKVKSFSETNWYEWGRKHHVSDLKRIYVNVKTREKLPFFLHDCKNYSGSVLAIFIKDVTLDPQILCDKLNKIDWEELGFFSEGRFAFTQRSLENVNLPTDF